MKVPPLFGSFNKLFETKKKGDHGLSSVVPEPDDGLDNAAGTPCATPGGGTPSGGRTPRRASREEQNSSAEEQLAEAKLTQALLDDVMAKLSTGSQPFDDKHFRLVKNLQDAVRNHGRVDLMSMGTMGQVAVKRMPTKWVKTGPKEFFAAYPSASERPWYDMGIVKHLNAYGYPYVCDLIGVFMDKEESFVVTTFCTEGDLFAWCDREPPPGRERERVMLPIIGQVFSAVRWLHEIGIAHRDLSLENILLTSGPEGEQQVKVIDFGMATLQRMCRREVRGKQSYSAPEMHLDAEYDAFLSDEFAVGVVLFAMAAQDYPWTSTKRGQCQLFEFVGVFGMQKFLQKRKARKGNALLIDILSPKFIEVIEGLLAFKPRHRAVLGESFYIGGSSVTINVWDLPWMEGQEVTSSPSQRSGPSHVSDKKPPRDRIVGG